MLKDMLVGELPEEEAKKVAAKVQWRLGRRLCFGGLCHARRWTTLTPSPPTAPLFTAQVAAPAPGAESGSGSDWCVIS